MKILFRVCKLSLCYLCFYKNAIVAFEVPKLNKYKYRASAAKVLPADVVVHGRYSYYIEQKNRAILLFHGVV